MIEQYTIAATPKYNFPQSTMDASLPRCFVEQSMQSLQHVQGQVLQLNQHYLQQSSSLEVPMQPLQLMIRPINLRSRHEETTVAACDTSSMRIGETNVGMLMAIRGAAVWRQNKCYRYSRFGPFVFHVTEENKKEIYSTLEKAYFNCGHEQNRQCLPNLLQMPMRMASLLERWIQAMLSRTVSNGLVLLDGSLTSGTGDTPIQRMKEIVTSAERRDNVILAFSKMTNLRINGLLITSMPFGHKAPCLFEVGGLKPKPPIVLLGSVYVARLAQGGYGFRLDIDKESSSERRIVAVERLLGNDVLSQGYPETLRLAHILCTFTANEVIAMQHFAVHRYGLRLVNRPDMHKLLFGPFGRGEFCS